ncbi:2-amino-4-hydroxy-6-hydroxymethyldihydropteridine diphosphokinase [Cellvibrio japonicus]|uniref:2-amino-4-hydroxy-6-hydroxymethyldihydropteridine diphosphokinase n=1 Tax=Cellvibrio japonicus (strain Ueda107) TaxID=498211 RepID=B3PKA7_CELJU|nr:2-amino-4-hydroxy-6-hydroxymethyldihydropteridine diphosphokinase [Cellvibrio japonicus]ACE86048.1 2-amino-4-hydroxy-6-hydroxymethyldihydropteridine pyrophosphokinase [Cellvibrio japonicus Ueda107]QEI11424.1 2-amino-4-hydroxy-6-hydroxymethyldihydropteridine diphosphokinase [Cellvibrio japonicus]QEI14998.1 2-amino-4-hydroxy-6-hydroxymethyldihydropteridine diphosphokinase [Cellvibrio japonicus]QEI18578.1 2-amino-4-hydroxy-6-hydroxymethyldihydropteridine diphosphokinase [Cellvibrio japonicus]
MTAIYLSLGSNVDRHLHIRAALDALAELLGDLCISSVYESKSVGFDGSNFFNLVVGAETTLAIAELSERLKKIEDDNGRKRNGPKFSPRTLDIDILTYGDFVGSEAGVALPRAEIIQNAFVLWPLAEIAPETRHPLLQQTYANLWAGFDRSSQLLWPIDFDWQGKVISRRVS